MIKTYYLLTKPGILFGNLIVMAAGCALASQGSMDFRVFLAASVGLCCVMGAGCVFNNYGDQDADKKMERTKNRALPQGVVTGRNALIFASVLCLIGIGILWFYTNMLALGVALCGFFTYVVLYGVTKYRSVYGTLVGSIAGAVPPVVGYCAVAGHLDKGAFLLFCILVLWQMPHFFAIAMYRMRDYAAASIPVLPLKKGIPATKVQMSLYSFAFMSVAWMLTPLGYTGSVYLVVSLVLGLAWFVLSLRGFKAKNDIVWARQMFRFSLVVITLLSAVAGFDRKEGRRISAKQNTEETPLTIIRLSHPLKQRFYQGKFS